MKRALLLVQEGLTFDMLTEDQQAAIRSVFGQYVMPMPGTIPFNGMVICDALTADNFDPAVMGAFGLSWVILFLGQWDGKSNYYDEIITPLDQAEFMNYLPDPEEGEKVFVMPHKFMGWPDILPMQG